MLGCCKFAFPLALLAFRKITRLHVNPSHQFLPKARVSVGSVRRFLTLDHHAESQPEEVAAEDGGCPKNAPTELPRNHGRGWGPGCVVRGWRLVSRLNIFYDSSWTARPFVSVFVAHSDMDLGAPPSDGDPYWKMAIQSIHQGNGHAWVIGTWFYTGAELREKRLSVRYVRLPISHDA